MLSILLELVTISLADTGIIRFLSDDALQKLFDNP